MTILMPLTDRPNAYHTKKALLSLIQNDIYDLLKKAGKVVTFTLEDRITVIADVDHFRIMEDRTVWEQARRRAPHTFEVYWDDVHICDMNELESPIEVKRNFLIGFLKEYKEGRISLTPYTDYEIEQFTNIVKEQEKKEDAMIAKFETKRPETIEEEISNTAIAQVLKEKKEKKKRAKKKMG